MHYDEFLAFIWFAQADDQFIKILNRNETRRHGVEFRPDVNELIEGIVLDGQLEVICLAKESIDDYSNEQVDKDLEDEQVEHYEEGVGVKSISAAFRPSILLHWLEGLVLTALILRTEGPSVVEHNHMPWLTCRTSQQQKEAGIEVTEINMLVQFLHGPVYLSKSKQWAADDRKHEEYDDQEEA